MIKNFEFIDYKKKYIELVKDFFPNDANRISYGIVYTPFSVIDDMLSLFPDYLFNNFEIKWLDVGSGFGNFSVVLLYKYFESNYKVLSLEKLLDIFVKNQLYLSEILQNQILYLKNLFGVNINLFENFLTIDQSFNQFFDCIIGNPPYNYGSIKTPTNNLINKKNDGRTVWQDFIFKSISLLKQDGYLSLIVPAIWLKPDRSGIYNLLSKYKILYLKCFSSSQTSKIFEYNAQTPTCFFLIQKTEILTDIKNINIYDKIYSKYISYSLRPSYPIPLTNISIINKFLFFVKKYGNLSVSKTNSPSIHCNFCTHYSSYYPYSCISTCKFDYDNKSKLNLFKIFSDIPCSYYGDVKVILAHKMYGFPYFDEKGIYGISQRDNYIIKDYTFDDLKNIAKFLSCKSIIYLFDSTRYRMRYLEKYIFEFLPDITLISELKNLSDNILERDQLIAKVFNLSDEEIIDIQKVKDFDYFL